MKLSISNLAWTAEQDELFYELMSKVQFEGLEIAPTRIIPSKPYENLEVARRWSNSIKMKYGLNISSIQSIWYGRSERVFGTKEERDFLLKYTKQAMDFAEKIGCKNIVFGCPQNRNILGDVDKSIEIDFFSELAYYAEEHNTILSIEANPSIYNTNYINTTVQAIELVNKIDSYGLKLNVDIGTMLYNGESVDVLKSYITLINHVHISEPYLKNIEKRDIHYELAQFLRKENYTGYVSIEMCRQNSISTIYNTCNYVKELFR